MSNQTSPVATAQGNRKPVEVREFSLSHPKTAAAMAAVMFTGSGPAVIQAISQRTGESELAVLDAIVKRLLVKKGADWTSPILSEYLGLYEDSLGTFTLVWDTQARQLVSHGAVFQSAANPRTGLVAHIRTTDSWNGLGLGTLVTEAVTRAAFEQGAQIVTLATDDKRHRLQQGEKAAHGMYSKIGFAILAEKEMADTVDWLMVINPEIFAQQQKAKQANGGRFPKEIAGELRLMQAELIKQTRERLSENLAGGRVQPIRDGDLANLFLLMNLCPLADFRVKLSAWGVHLGPEFERSFVVSARPAIMDRDRLEDASLVLCDDHGAVIAVCAARQATPFTQNAMEVDFYCLPRFLEKNRLAVLNLITTTLEGIAQSPARPKPCRLLFSGVDEPKLALFQELGFTRLANTRSYFGPEGKVSIVAHEYEKRIA